MTMHAVSCHLFNELIKLSELRVVFEDGGIFLANASLFEGHELLVRFQECLDGLLTVAEVKCYRLQDRTKFNDILFLMCFLECGVFIE